jgi:hypothetical protein
MIVIVRQTSRMDASSLGGLASAIDLIPMLTEKKKHIDEHTIMATALLKQLQVRQQQPCGYGFFSIHTPRSCIFFC